MFFFLLQDLGVGTDEVIALALLLGSDYTEGVKGVGIVNAMEVYLYLTYKQIIFNVCIYWNLTFFSWCVYFVLFLLNMIHTVCVFFVK